MPKKVLLADSVGRTVDWGYNGDVYRTYADVTDLMNDFDFKPSTSIEEGLGKFAEWYKEYYKV